MLRCNNPVKIVFTNRLYPDSQRQDPSAVLEQVRHTDLHGKGRPNVERCRVITKGSTMNWDSAIARVAPYAAIITAVSLTFYVFAGYFQ